MKGRATYGGWEGGLLQQDGRHVGVPLVATDAAVVPRPSREGLVEGPGQGTEDGPTVALGIREGPEGQKRLARGVQGGGRTALEGPHVCKLELVAGRLGQSGGCVYNGCGGGHC